MQSPQRNPSIPGVWSKSLQAGRTVAFPGGHPSFPKVPFPVKFPLDFSMSPWYDSYMEPTQCHALDDAGKKRNKHKPVPGQYDGKPRISCAWCGRDIKEEYDIKEKH